MIRDWIEIYYDVLKVCRVPSTATIIARKARVNTAIFYSKVIPKLSVNDLIKITGHKGKHENWGTLWQITEKGEKYIQMFVILKGLLGEVP